MMTRSKLTLMTSASRAMRVAVMAIAAVACGSAAKADMIFHDGAGFIQPAENVLLPTGQTGLTVTGETNQTHVTVNFSQPTLPEQITTPANGQSRIAGVDGAYTSLRIELASGYFFTQLEANPIFLSGGIDFVVGAFDPVNSIWTEHFISGSGNSYFSVEATDGWLISYVDITGPANSIQDVRQIRIGGVQNGQGPLPVPEPGTAALLAFGAFGFAGNLYRMRRQAS